MVGEVDELEEDVGWSFSCLEGVMVVEEGTLEEELVGKPGPTIGTKFSVLHCIRIPFFMRCGFWPLIHSHEYPCSSQSFPSDNLLAYPRGLSLWRIYPIHWHKLWPFRCSFGYYDCRRTSRRRQRIHFRKKQVLLADHVHRRSGVDNKFSFLMFKILMAQAGANFPKVRRMRLYFYPLNFRMLLASLHAASRAHRSCQSVSSWDRSSNFGASALRWWGSLGQISPSEGFWSRMLAWRTTAFANWSHRIGFRMFELFRKIDEDFGGSIS